MTGIGKKLAVLAGCAALLSGTALCAYALTEKTPASKLDAHIAAYSKLQTAVPAAAPAGALKKVSFNAEVAPLFAKYCQGCHSGNQPKGEVLLKFKDEAHARSFALSDEEVWDRVAVELSTNHMPPATVKNRPTEDERALLVNWIKNDVLAGGKPDPGPLVIHRLNNREYANTMRDVLYLPTDFDVNSDFPADERGDGFDNNAGTLTLSPVLIEKYLSATEKAVDVAMVPGVDKQIDGNVNVLGPNKINDPSRKMREDYANRQTGIRVNMEVFLPRAWRRPVTKAEVDGIMKFVSLGFAHDGESRNKAQGLAIRAALMSPNFLFRMETDPKADGTNKVFQLSEHQLASRLSYFLWSTMPDDALFTAAKDGKLRAGLDAELTRMLKDPKATSLTKDFLGQWLEIRGLDQTPNASPELLAAMKGETEAFFNYIIQENRPITDFLSADYTFVNATLAKHYGIAGVTGPEFRKISVDKAQRGGIFTQASVLTLTSKPLGTSRRTSPVVRGKWILENIFNQRIPPPPPNVPTLSIDDGKELKGTVRQIFEQHRENPICAGCHARMDPYGFALENYDGYGQWRLQDNNVNVDASGDINGKKFAGPVEFRAILATRTDDFRRAFVRKMLSYSLGRGIQGYDRPAVEDIVAKVKADGDRFSSVIVNIVKSYPFQNARGSVLATNAKAAPATKPASKAELGGAKLQPTSFNDKK